MPEVIVTTPDALRSLVQGAVAAGVKAALEKVIKPDQRLLDEEEAASRLGVAVATLRCWRGAKKGPKYRKIGRMVRYASADLDAWVAASKVLTIDSPELLHEKSCL